MPMRTGNSIIHIRKLENIDDVQEKRWGQSTSKGSDTCHGVQCITVATNRYKLCDRQFANSIQVSVKRNEFIPYPADPLCLLLGYASRDGDPTVNVDVDAKRTSE